MSPARPGFTSDRSVDSGRSGDSDHWAYWDRSAGSDRWDDSGHWAGSDRSAGSGRRGASDHWAGWGRSADWGQSSGSRTGFGHVRFRLPRAPPITGTSHHHSATRCSTLETPPLRYGCTFAWCAIRMTENSSQRCLRIAQDPPETLTPALRRVAISSRSRHAWCAGSGPSSRTTSASDPITVSIIVSSVSSTAASSFQIFSNSAT